MSAQSDTSSLLTLSESLRESLYRYQNERRFQSSSTEYPWPCDRSGMTMELVLAQLFERTYENGLYWEESKGQLADILSEPSPDGPSRILDLGSGATASWAISMAERFPCVEVIGVDLIPSDLTFLPPNLTTEVADLFEGLPYPDDFFSLIHHRCPGAGLPAFFENPRSDFLADVARVLRPGGVLILEDLHDTRTPFLASSSENSHLRRALERHAPCWDEVERLRPQDVGRPTWGARMADQVRFTRGFQDAVIKETSFSLPLGAKAVEGPSERQAGTLHREAWLTSWEMCRVAMGLDEERIKVERETDEKALPEQDVGLLSRYNVVWAIRGTAPVSP